MPYKLKVNLVERDADLQIVTEGIVGKFSIVTDEQAETTEVIDTNYADVVHFVWSRVNGSLQIGMALGGYDSGGNFQADLRFRMAQHGIGKNQNPNFWTNYNIDGIQQISWDTIKQFLHNRGAIHQLASVIWGNANMESLLYDENDQLIGDYTIQPT